MADRDAKKLKKRIAAIKQRKAQRAMDPFSLALREFCRPLLAVAGELSGPENAVSLGIFAWNAAFLPDERWRANFRKSIAQFGLNEEAQEALEGIIEEMIRQKGVLHPDDRRVVTSYDVQTVDGEVFIEAKSTLATKTLIPHMRDMDSKAAPCSGAPHDSCTAHEDAVPHDSHAELAQADAATSSGMQHDGAQSDGAENDEAQSHNEGNGASSRPA